ncbi:hypothetical protein IEQ34_004914 [Dendrobium chrysotoxum]|uniref:Disease resistance protein winged helix domain-containing protein n=1 Tax=Dendrobium chrysotoxum TaxID=161865 RepID=A0AAV7H877_DENCH|nr:hypothetical protein IEQ34_004914 [Dendrobium chrysotoxum]
MLLSPQMHLSFVGVWHARITCFGFCSIVPQIHVFNTDDLARMWIALGCIQPSLIQRETTENIGGWYFDILVKKSFFDNDLLHEMAHNIFVQDCLKVVGDEKFPLIIPGTLRHLSFEDLGYYKNIEYCKMHDLLHELAHNIFVQECLKVVGDE